MTDPAALDSHRVRRAFDRAASNYEAAAFLAREVAARMSERLDLLRAAPRSVLDLGSGTGRDARMLRERYRECRVVELDVSHAMLLQSRESASWWRRGVLRLRGTAMPLVCADMTKLPFAYGTFDMVWSNFVLHWVDLPRALAEMYRVLRPGGVCMFSTLGPDTLQELRSAYAACDSHVHVNRFVDLHDIGDMLVQARFADPVMDMEYVRVTYADILALLRDLRSAGGGNANFGRPQALSGRRGYQRMSAAYEAHREDGKLPATFEVVYGHAWRPEVERRTPGGEAVITFQPPRGRAP